MRTLITLLCFCCSALMFSACEKEDDVGIVARVNGRPIYLSQLEFQHDLLHMDGAGSFVPTVEILRSEYGKILGDLIVLELVDQDLEARGLSVTDEEMAEEERKVRADYPGDSFEQVLVEEYIDLAAWRGQLRRYKALQKFHQQVLRPRITIDYREAEAYYKEHIKEFRLPETLNVLVLRSSSRGPLQEVLRAFASSGNPESVKGVTGVAVHEVTLRHGQLTSPWLETLQGMSAGEASLIMEEKFGFEALILLERLPVKLLDPSQAYPVVEKALLDKKMRLEFEKWLDDALNDASLQISSHLLPSDQEEEPTVVTVGPAQEVQSNGSMSATPLEDEEVNATDEAADPLDVNATLDDEEVDENNATAAQ
ncbi:MAG: peptidylprolyl isomerase [Desulfovibrionaceae bacterium]